MLAHNQNTDTSTNSQTFLIGSYYAARKSVVTVTVGSNPETITHNLNTQDVMVSVYESGVNVVTDVTVTGANTITIGGASIVGKTLKVVVIG